MLAPGRPARETRPDAGAYWLPVTVRGQWTARLCPHLITVACSFCPPGHALLCLAELLPHLLTHCCYHTCPCIAAPVAAMPTGRSHLLLKYACFCYRACPLHFPRLYACRDLCPLCTTTHTCNMKYLLKHTSKPDKTLGISQTYGKTI